MPRSDPPRSERLLALLLRLVGAVMLLALPAVVMPTAWMDACHRALGLGPLPAGPIVEYLTRSISFLYAIHGGLLLVVASDVRRNVGVLVYLAAAGMAFGAALVAIDLRADLPVWWVLTEGPPLTAVGLLILLLTRSVPRAGS